MLSITSPRQWGIILEVSWRHLLEDRAWCVLSGHVMSFGRADCGLLLVLQDKKLAGYCRLLGSRAVMSCQLTCAASHC